MEYEGILRVTKKKKSPITAHEVEYTDEKGKRWTPRVPEAARFYDADALLNKEVHCRVEANGNDVKKCVVAGYEKEPVIIARPEPKKVVPSQPDNQYKRPAGNNYGRQGGQRTGQGYNSYACKTRPRPGSAPYDFIPYLDYAIAPPARDEERKWSGEIICQLTAITPLLVSGAQEKQENKPTVCRFAKVGGVNIIPGTAIKGMLRSLMEILSFSGLKPLSKRRLFYRDVAEDRYRKLFPENVRGGFLRQVGADFYLRETHVDPRHADAPEEPGYEKVETGRFTKNGAQSPSYFFRKLKDDALGQKIEDDEIVMRFWEQLTPNQEARWPKDRRKERLGKAPGLPVFFRVDENGKPADLGFCRYFRLAYQYSPYDLAWPDGDADEIMDMARTIFGQVGKKSVAGRVAIDPFEIHGKPFKPEGIEAILGTPKPTCLGFYIGQNPDQLVTASGGRKYERTSMRNYNEITSRLRGRKLYWHRQDLVELQADMRDKTNVISRLHPLAAGARGTFVIHVNRLTDSELGCLLKALELPKGCMHKLGMGRSLGLGSVRIEIQKANIGDCRARHGSLAKRLEAGAAQEEMSPEKRQELRGIFEKHIFESVKAHYGGAKEYADLEPIRDLFLMLNYERKPAPQKIATMTLKEFRDNLLLPTPPQVLAQKS